MNLFLGHWNAKQGFLMLNCYCIDKEIFQEIFDYL